MRTTVGYSEQALATSHRIVKGKAANDIRAYVTTIGSTTFTSNHYIWRQKAGVLSRLN